MSQHNHNNQRDQPVTIRYKHSAGMVPEIVIRSEGWPGIMRVPLSNVARVI